MTKENPFPNLRVRVNIKASSKGILQPDITVENENGELVSISYKNTEDVGDVDKTKQTEVDRVFEKLDEFIEKSKAKGFKTCFDEQ